MGRHSTGYLGIYRFLSTLYALSSLVSSSSNCYINNLLLFMMLSPLRVLCRSSLRQSHAAMTQRGVDKTFHSDSAKMRKFTLADKYHGLEKNVWVEFIQLALEYKPLNLRQGFPDDLVPYNVLDSLSEVAQESLILNQYTRGFGHP